MMGRPSTLKVVAGWHEERGHDEAPVRSSCDRGLSVRSRFAAVREAVRSRLWPIPLLAAAPLRPEAKQRLQDVVDRRVRTVRTVLCELADQPPGPVAHHDRGASIATQDLDASLVAELPS